MRRILFLFSFLMVILSSNATISWMGNHSANQSSNSQEVTFYVEMYNNYVGCHAEVAIYESGVWSNYELDYAGASGSNSMWSKSISLTSGSNEYYFHGWDDWGAEVYDSNDANNYFITVYPNESTQAGNWNTSTNWSFGVVPNITSSEYVDVVIKHTIALDVNSTITDLTINSGSSLTINASKGLKVNGTVTNNAGASGLVIKGGQNNGYFIHSTADIDATVELYFSGGLWHYMSSPVDNFSSNFNALNLGLTEGAGNDQFYYWEEPTGTWIDILNSTLFTSTGFSVCKGYTINYQNSNPTKSFTGKLIHDDQSITLTKASKGDYDGWNLIGNPFASTLAVNDKVSVNNLWDANSTIIDPLSGLQFWSEVPGWTEANGARDYQTKNQSTETWDLPYVSFGQAFLVKALNNSTNFSFPENCRLEKEMTYYKSSESLYQHLRLGVENPNFNTNVLKFVFAENCTDGPDAFFDALKFKGNPDLAFYSSLISGDERDFEIQCLAPLTENKEIFLGLDAEITGEYTMFLDTLVNFPEDYTFEIEDTQTGAIINLEQAKFFTFDVNEPGAFKNRFILRFKSIVGIHENTIQHVDLFEMYATNQIIHLSTTEPVNKANILVFNTLGQQIVSQQMHGQSTQIWVDKPGTYIVRIQTEQGVQSKKVIVFY
jgi:hypothetical protein